VPDGKTEQDVADLFGYLMSRYQSMRTRLEFGDDGQVRQSVSESGETWLEIIDAADDADPHQVAADLKEQYQLAERDYTTQWPMRMAVVRHRGKPAYRVTALCHLVSDGYGVVAMMADQEALEAGQPNGPVTAMEPLEEASYQASPAGQRRSRAAERYWEHMLATIPARRFRESSDPRQPRYWITSMHSRAMQLAMQPIAERTQADTSPVLLAAFAVAVARVTGINPVVPRVTASNRFRPRLAEAVAPIIQTCPCAVDVAGASFDEAVMRAYRASVGAYKNAYFVPARIRELVASVSAERGEPVDVAMVYNDRRMSMVTRANEVLGTPREVTALPEPGEITAALPLTTVAVDEMSDHPADLFTFHLMNSPDSVKALISFDTHYAAPGDVEAVLREMEAITVAAAFSPATPTGL
jgi:hypothetical protein